mmetsp:Transcript_31979/g.67022  ORF Transcript_31979/g.67022 Transcript_31979/m.67022 type:complete len:210 (+) Transcript_31979:1324-1953(+)
MFVCSSLIAHSSSTRHCAALGTSRSTRRPPPGVYPAGVAAVDAAAFALGVDGGSASAGAFPRPFFAGGSSASAAGSAFAFPRPFFTGGSSGSAASALAPRPFFPPAAGGAEEEAAPEVAATNCASSHTSTPRLIASSFLLPAPGPATRMSVFPETAATTFAPAATAIAVASARLVCSVPVKTIVLPWSDMRGGERRGEERSEPRRGERR